MTSKIPASNDTNFLVGSMSKAVTCAAILVLYDQEKLNLDDDVSKYLS